MLFQWENNALGRKDMLKFIEGRVKDGYKRYNENDKIILESWEHGKVSSRRKQFIIKKMTNIQQDIIVCNSTVKDTCNYKLPWGEGSPKRIATELLKKGEIDDLDFTIIKGQYSLYNWIHAGD